jgi:RNA polymerase subunit RPABC4/transcription elongation factor Spt4
MSKEVINHICRYCESSFKLTYDTDEVTSLPKFCPMCASESIAEEMEDQEVDFNPDYNDDPVL